MNESIELRPSVRWFAEQMEIRLGVLGNLRLG